MTRTNLSRATSRGFTKGQLASTANYQAKNLKDIQLENNDLTGWDFSGQDLTNASLFESTLTNANFRGANLRNARVDKFGTPLVAIFDANTVYNQWTVFPKGFDPVAKGLKLMHTEVGDFDPNDVLEIADIEALQSRLLRGDSHLWLPDLRYDSNGDRVIDSKDIRAWVQDLKHTWFGDSNLDGEFNSTDLITVFQAGQYEDQVAGNSTWSTGDWDTDGEFTTSDLVVAFQDGGYEAGPRAAVAAVPEPSGGMLLAMSLVGLLTSQIVRRRVPATELREASSMLS